MNSFEFEELDEFFEDIEEYRVHEYLYRIEDNRFNDIVSYLLSNKLPKKYLTYKDVIRERLNRILNLGGMDTIIVTDEVIYVKIFIRLEVQTDEERRACGISPEYLEELKEQYFENDSYRDEAMRLLEFVADDNLSYKKMTPHDFNKIFIPIFINILELIVIEYTDIEDLRLLKGFSLFLLRKIFDDFLLYLSENILYNFSNQDKKAVEFMSFFSANETIDKKGIRRKANPILDESNHVWNMTTIRSVMIQHKHAKQAIYDKKNSIKNIKKRLQDYHVELNELEKEKQEKEQHLIDIDKKINIISNTLQKAQNSVSKQLKYKENDEEKIYDRKILISKLLKDEDRYLKDRKMVEKEIRDWEIKIKNKHKDIDIWTRTQKEAEESLKKIELKGHPVDEQYERIKRALAKTLARR